LGELSTENHYLVPEALSRALARQRMRLRPPAAAVTWACLSPSL